MRLRILILDACDDAGRAALQRVGCSSAGELYARTLHAQGMELALDLGFPTQADWRAPPLADYDGLCWTGSNLTIHSRADAAAVAPQVALARAAFAAGVPQFGSCWAAQLAAVAAGGECAAHPRGREFGVARDIALSPAGRAHPLFAGKPQRFDALASHQDQVVSLPPGAKLLASNAWSQVQALEVRHGAGVFWALQYHPEYDLREIARLCAMRKSELLAQGHFPDAASARRFMAHAEALHHTPTRDDLAATLRTGPEIRNPTLRTLELRNWLTTQATPHATLR